MVKRVKLLLWMLQWSMASLVSVVNHRPESGLVVEELRKPRVSAPLDLFVDSGLAFAAVLVETRH